MKMMAILGTVLLSSVAAIAQTPADPASGPATTKRGVSGDPNEVICVQEKATGSRLGARRVCRTRAEWAEHRAEHKQEIERAQQQLQTSGE